MSNTPRTQKNLALLILRNFTYFMQTICLWEKVRSGLGRSCFLGSPAFCLYQYFLLDSRDLALRYRNEMAASLVFIGTNEQDALAG